MAGEKIEETKNTQTTLTNAPSRFAGVKNFAKVSGTVAVGTVLGTGAVAAAKAGYNAIRGEKKEQAKAALGGVSGILKL